MPSGAAGVPCVLGGTEGAAGQGSSHHPSQEWGSWGHQGSPSPGHWAGTSPGWDVAGQQEGVSYGSASHSQPGAAPKAAPKSQVQCWLQPPQPCWEPLPTLQWDSCCSWLLQCPPFSQPKPQEWDAPRSLAQGSRQTLLLCTSMASHSFLSRFLHTRKLLGEHQSLRSPESNTVLSVPNPDVFTRLHKPLKCSPGFYQLPSFLVVCFSPRA